MNNNIWNNKLKVVAQVPPKVHARVETICYRHKDSLLDRHNPVQAQLFGTPKILSAFSWSELRWIVSHFISTPILIYHFVESPNIHIVNEWSPLNTTTKHKTCNFLQLPLICLFERCLINIMFALHVISSCEQTQSDGSSWLIDF